MKDAAGKTPINVLREIVGHVVDCQIKLEALERVLEETNPLVHELYRGEIDTLTKLKAAPRTIALIEKLEEVKFSK